VRLEISLFSCFWNCDLICFGCILLSALLIQRFNISDLNVREKFITNTGFGRLFLSPIISILSVSSVEQPFTLDIFG